MFFMSVYHQGARWVRFNATHTSKNKSLEINTILVLFWADLIHLESQQTLDIIMTGKNTAITLTHRSPFCRSECFRYHITERFSITQSSSQESVTNPAHNFPVSPGNNQGEAQWEGKSAVP